MKKIITTMLIISLMFLAGCTQEDNGAEQSPYQQGRAYFDFEFDQNIIQQGESTILTMQLTNYYVNDLENVQVRFEPEFPGIIFRIDGTNLIESENTGTWIIDIDTSSGIIPRTYTFRPIICFDYSQKHRGFFRVNNDEPSTRNVDLTSSDSGPMRINFNDLRGINARVDFDSLDFSITYDFANNYQGLINNNILEEQILSSGSFELFSEHLNLRALQGASRLDPTTIPNPLNNLCNSRSLSDGTYHICAFEHAQDNRVFAANQFGFRINVLDSLSSEIETYFLHTLNYNICLRPINDLTLIVERSSR